MIAESKDKKPRNSRRRTQEERSSYTKEKLIRAAIDTVRSKGLQAITIATVAKKAGVTPGAVQHQFGNKSTLLQAIASEIFSLRLDESQSLPRTDLPLAQRVEQILDIYWKNVFSSPDYLLLWGLYHSAQYVKAFSRALSLERNTQAAQSTRIWNQVFPELADRGQQFEIIRAFALSSLRGIALLALFKVPAAELDGQRRILHRAVVSEVETLVRSKADGASAAPGGEGMASHLA